jgi:DNA invertase Pin-like site-specific DNA recombinase
MCIRDSVGSEMCIRDRFSVANMESQLTKSRMISGYHNHIKNGGKVGRKKGSIETEDETIQKHTDVIKLLKKKLSIRHISGLTNKSTNTVLKVKSTAIKLQIL